jgi:hypothetical protein
MTTEAQTPQPEKPATKAKPAPAAPTPVIPGPSDLGKTIAVRLLVFHQPHPSFSARSSIQAESAANKGKRIIEFVPAMHHHRVVTHPTDPGKPVRVQFIHDANVADWEPA